MDATVAAVSIDSVGPDTVAIEFESPGDFDAQPGQFVKLTAVVNGEEYSRFYTLSSPDVAETFEVTVEIGAEAGPFSHHLTGLESGDVIDMTGPFGTDYYEGEPRIVVLAGGPGVGPAVAIGERALSNGATVALVYQTDQPDTPVHENRLDALDADGATVYVTDGEIDDAVGDVWHDDARAFVYGFADFVDAARGAIEAAGGDARNAKIENFG